MAVKLRRTPDKNKKRGKEPPMPLPEAIDGGSWTIKQSGGRRDGVAELHPVAGGKLTIPLGGGDVERALRLHEQTHIAISPRDAAEWDGVDQTVLQLCEDLRVNQALRIAGYRAEMQALIELAPDMTIEWQRLKLDYDKANKARDKAGRSLKVIPPRAIVAARVMAATDTGLFESEWAAAQKLDTEAANQGWYLAQQFKGREVRPFSEAKLAAELLCEMFGTPGDPLKEEEQSPAPGLMPQQDALSPSIPNTFLQDLNKIQKKMEELEKQGGKPQLGDPEKGIPKIWGEMIIVEKPRPLRLNGKLLGGFKKIPDVRGRKLKQVHRLAKDGRVFNAKHNVRRRGGAVLIDCSGSMHITPEEIEAVVIALPASVIATYSADHHRGQLWIVARDGKRAKQSDLNPPNAHNVIDFPALEWLSQQKTPRYWVSDGIVTEVGGRHTSRIVAACRVLQQRGKITRVPSVNAVLSEEGWERIS